MDVMHQFALGENMMFSEEAFDKILSKIWKCCKQFLHLILSLS